MGISELHSITCFGNLQPPLFFLCTCNLPIFMQFTKFFLFVCILCFQLSFSIIFPLLLPSPACFWSFLSVFLSCFIYKICSLVSFLIAPLGYLISVKYLCRYSRNTEENCLSFILCEVSLSLIAILNILFICDFVYSAIPCDPGSFQHSIAIFDLSLWPNLSTQGACDFVNLHRITQHPTFVSPAVAHQSQVLVLYLCLVHCTLQASACTSASSQLRVRAINPLVLVLLVYDNN